MNVRKMKIIEVEIVDVRVQARIKLNKVVIFFYFIYVINIIY